MRRYLSSFYAILLALLLLLPGTMSQSARAASQTFSYAQAQALGLSQTGWVVSGSYGHDHLESTDAGNEIDLAFSGTGLTLGGLYYSAPGTRARVSIDGGAFADLVAQSDGFRNDAYIVASGLPDGRHTVRFKQAPLGQYVFVYTGATSGDVFATVTGASPALGQFDTTQPLVSPALKAGAISKTSVVLSWGIASGGTAPYTYQLFRTAATSGNEVSGATISPSTDAGRTLKTTYTYYVKTTDAAGNTVVSAPLVVKTHGAYTVKVAFIGDSITYGFGSGTSPPAEFLLKLQALYSDLDVVVYNYGVSGQRVRQLSRLSHAGAGGNGQAGITALVTQMQSDGVQYAGFMEGTNDWYADYLRADWLADVADVASAVNAAGIPLYINQCIYRSDTSAAGNSGDSSSVGLPFWNAGLSALAFSANLRQGDTVNYAAIKSAFLADASTLPDFLHPSTPGSTLVGQNWALAMGPSIVSEVLPPQIASITISPATIALTSGQTTQNFVAVAKDSTGAALAVQPTFTWTTSGPSISSGGVLTISTAYTVTATASGVSGTATATLPVSTGGGLSPSDVQAAVSAALTAQGYTSARAAKLDNADVLLSSRLSTNNFAIAPNWYTAPVAAPTASQNANAVLAAVVDGSLTVKQAMAVQAAIAAGRYSVGTLNTVTHTQITTYYKQDGATPLSTSTTTFDTSNTKPVGRSVVYSNLP